MADSLVLVTGATGTVGTAVLADLKGKPGIKLQALVRNPDKAATLVHDAVKASGIPWTILKPHYCTQNMLSSASSVASEGCCT